ncbi:STAS domain-containing protein [Streptomyces sp. NPDC021056]|uniref:STAS domain-containing protein n=1 Tax=Streptomyces sp. NPDC021056 TaxID=3155012 RepID=UPI0033CF9EBF
MGTCDIPFTLHHYVADRTTILELSGELDIWADHELAARITALLDRPHLDVLVDLRGVTFLDAGGLRLLVRISKQTVQREGTLHIVCDSPRLRRILHITRLDRSLPLLDVSPAALATPGEREVPA